MGEAENGAPGFYENVLDGARRRNYAAARKMRGVDAEIALLRLRLRSLIEADTDDLASLIRLADALGRLLRLQAALEGGQARGVAEAVARVFREIGEPLGLGDAAAVAALSDGSGAGGAGERAAGPRPDPERGDGPAGRQE